MIGLIFERFALFLDARYFDFQETSLKTEVQDKSQLSKVIGNYIKIQKQMSDLPASLALSVTPIVNLDHIVDWPDDLSQLLLGFLGRSTDDEQVECFLQKHQLTFPLVTWSTYVDVPLQGFFIGLQYPWKFSSARFVEALTLDEKEINRIKKKKAKFVEQIEFTNEGDKQIGNSTGSYLLCNRYAKMLPFGLSFDNKLLDLDARFGTDEFEEHEDEENQLTRRWRLNMQGNIYDGGLETPHYMLIVDFIGSVMMSLRVLIR